MDRDQRPTGLVTFLFTDIEGSTGLWEREPGAMRVALAQHDRILTRAVEENGGYVFSTAGDAFAAAFSTPTQAAVAARAAQQALDGPAWSADLRLRVRMGIHTGTADERDGNYFGPVVNRAARLMSTAHGGQILLSDVTALLLERVSLLDLGPHLLKDLSAPERIWQLGSGSHPPLRTLDRRLHNLPIQVRELIGRATDVAEIVRLVEHHRVVSLLGIGGIGKTRLALAVAAELVDEFHDGVWFVDLQPINETQRLLETIADAAGLRLPEGVTLEQFAAALSGRNVLFLIDNCELLTDAVADAVEALLESTSVHFLITSRQPLDLPDEWSVRVPPLEIDHSLHAPSVVLFALAAARAGVEIDERNLDECVTICRHLDGLPLALELAGAQLRHLTLTELVERLDRRFDLLERGRRGRRARQSSLLAVLQDSWAQLDGLEHELMRQLAAFAGAFDLDSVESVAHELGAPSDVLRAFASLVDHSLVVEDHDGGHRLLETVKLFAQQRWADGGAAGGYLERHTAWGLGHVLAHSIDSRHTSIELGGWVARHYDDLRSIESRLFAEARSEDLVDLVSGHNLSVGYGGGSRAVALIERIDRYLASGRFDARQAGRLHLLAALAGISARRADRIDSSSRVAVAQLRDTGDVHDLAMAHHATALTALVSDPATATRRLERAIALAESTGAPAIADYARSYETFTTWLARLHEPDEAHAGPDALRELDRRLEGRPYSAAHSMYHQARMAERFLTSPPEQLETYVAMRDAQTALGVPFTESWQVFHVAAVANLGDVAATAAALATLRDEFQRNGLDGLADPLVPLSVLAWRLGEVNLARRWLTAIRYDRQNSMTLVYVAIYRQLRDEIGLQTSNPLVHSSLIQLTAEGFAWLEQRLG